MDTRLMKQIKDILKEFPQYWNGEELQRPIVIDDLKSYDALLISALLKNQKIRENYSVKAGDVVIFKVQEFIDILRYKDYWADSYTKYSNTIGLSSEGKYLQYNTDVVLDFPYKDCVLEGGMTKEDTGKEEVFYNEVIARDEIDTLLSPKVLVNVKKYDSAGEHKVNSFSDDNNLIIKGNNLLALHSLKERYGNSINLIYIDPPFNTGNDSFKYNDRYNQSSWLTFMKNRLEVAKELLHETGNIFVHIDINQSHYLKVLMDSIFGKDNFVEEIIWSYGSASGGRAAGAKPVNVHDYILHYAKNYKKRKQNKVYTPYSEKYIKDWFKFDDGDGRIYRRRQRGKDSSGNSIWEKQYLDESKGVPLTTVWNDISQIYANPQAYKEANRATSEIEIDFGNSGQKPEKLLKRIIEMATDVDDIVLDFFMGTATTASTAIKLKRKVISIEQVYNQVQIGKKRLIDVVKGKKSGISKELDWTGGGSFIYAELMELNQVYMNKIDQVSTKEELADLWDELDNNADLNFQLDKEKLVNELLKEHDEEEGSVTFNDLTFDEQKEIFRKALDKNQLYVPYSEIEDKNVIISDNDKAFNHSFYSNEGE
ncbi:hypothetical protein UK3_01426 [Enterococcus faecium EnGen0305]|uniref:site-specific DNA-methyltransferase n=1 Tax=Enterococcus faecium TaxID=1352 RepID=UPI000330D2A8|nr:site-specific DNA-methyltransferase [Enterococcus faecium]EOL67938.1 hypothetical protein UK3_01426 [Enterococcus faecium EnGen0305]